MEVPLEGLARYEDACFCHVFFLLHDFSVPSDTVVNYVAMGYVYKSLVWLYITIKTIRCKIEAKRNAIDNSRNSIETIDWT